MIAQLQFEKITKKNMNNKIPKEYSWCVKSLRQSDWDKIVLLFDDATLYQTYSYGHVRWGRSSLKHLVIKKNNQIVGGCQIQIIRIPIIHKEIAYIPWGPLWRRSGFEKENDIFMYTLRVLREEFENKRNMYLRVVPNEIAEDNPKLPQILEKEGFRLQNHISPYRTFVVDIRSKLEDIKMNTLHQKWRMNLNRALRNNMEFQVGTSAEHYNVFEKIYREMYSRKQFVRFVDIEEFREINQNLPEELKLKIGICYSDKKPVAALVWSDIGTKGISILSGTAHRGLKLRGSYVLRWKMFGQLKDAGCLYSDQGGIDPVNNPGGFGFRSGLGGRDVTLLGNYDICNDKILSILFLFVDKFRMIIRLKRQKMNRIIKKAIANIGK